MADTKERVLIVSAVPALGWKAARSLTCTGREVYFAGPRGLVGRQILPHWRHYFELLHMRWIGRDRVDPAVLEEIEALARELDVDVVVPSDWPTTVLFGEHRLRVFGRRRFAAPNIDTLMALHDKWQFSRLLDRLGIPQPVTRLASELGDATTLRFPVLVKPCNASNGLGISAHGDVGSLRTHLDAQLEESLAQTLVQEQVGGEDVTVGLVADRGRLVALGCAMQRRWRRWFFRSDAVRDSVERIVADSGYHGPGHLDFRFDERRGRLWAIEFNPRLNGSLVYFTGAGLNIVDLALRMSNGERLEGLARPRDGLRVLEPTDIATGLYMTALMHAARRGLLPSHLAQRQVPARV